MSNPEFNNLPAGSYDLIIMDINGCVENENFTINAFNSPSVTFITDQTCPGQDDGSISINNPASANMEFAIDNNSDYSSGNSISNLHILNQSTYSQSVLFVFSSAE